MKIDQIQARLASGAGGMPPLQAMVYDHLLQHPDEVFKYEGDDLMQTFPQVKPSALRWTLWLLAKGGYIGKARLRLGRRLTTVYGAHDAIATLEEHLGGSS